MIKNDNDNFSGGVYILSFNVDPYKGIQYDVDCLYISIVKLKKTYTNDNKLSTLDANSKNYF